MEEWRDIKGFEDSYQVSSKGRVRSKDRMVKAIKGSLQMRRGQVINGTMMPNGYMAHSKNFKDLTGQKFHRLTFLEYVGRNESRNARWKVRCDCGTIFEVTATAVTHGSTHSCGCIRRERCLSGFKKFL